ncbi:MAG: hypothetical protein LRY71_11375 [Bacillaceae bacterium]|nr:hypothetical protein [Bacillaceae bacterium]
MSDEGFQKVKMAISTDHVMPDGLEAAMDQSNIFDLSYTTEAEAKELLADKKNHRIYDKYEWS